MRANSQNLTLILNEATHLSCLVFFLEENLKHQGVVKSKLKRGILAVMVKSNY